MAAESRTPEEERRLVKELERNRPPMKDGQEWYVLSYKWWELWKDYVNFDEVPGVVPGTRPQPAAIDNNDLLEDISSKKLKMGLMENYNHVIVDSPIWNLLHRWYSGGPDIPRRVITIGLAKLTHRVDLYPITLTFWKAPTSGVLADFNDFKQIQFSLQATLKEVQRRAAGVYSSPPHKARLWSFVWDNGKAVNYLRLDTNTIPSPSLEEAQLGDGASILFEVPNNEGSYPRDKPTLPSSLLDDNLTSVRSVLREGYSQGSSSALTVYGQGSSTSASSSSSSSWWGYGGRGMGNTAGRGPARGLAGLQNLGNTCFMNSALQCLSATRPLTRYFLSAGYVSDLNPTNPLGNKGQLALEYAGMLSELWSDKYSAVAPVKFKSALGKFAPQFSGYQQQDSQELLAFLLDGLHEDLNRVKVKPSVEGIESDGRPDEVIAQLAWEGHLLRNRSAIVDYFLGQYKSTVVCPIEGCGRVSITFDPFLFLSVPLPVREDRTVNVVYLRAVEEGDESGSGAPRPPLRYALQVPKHSQLRTLREAMSSLVGVPGNRLAFGDIYGNKIYNMMEDNKQVSYIRDSDLVFAFELPVPYSIVPATTAASGAATAAPKVDSADGNAGVPPTSETVPLPAEPATAQPIEEGEALEPYVHIQIAHRKRGMGAHVYGCLFGFPLVLSVKQKKTTNRQLRSLVWKHLKTTCLHSSEEAEKFAAAHTADTAPYKLIRSSPTLTSDMGEIPSNDEPIGLADREAIVIEWQVTEIEGLLHKADHIIKNDKTVELAEAEAKKAITLAHCLELYSQTETLSAENAWYCSKCKEHRQATKQLQLWKLPQVLVIHLKRFQYTRSWRDKLDTFVDFPFTLDMAPYLSRRLGEGDDQVYDLFAVSNHSGGLGGGHYTAYRKDDGKWWYCNDSHVDEADEKRVRTPEAYVLFYRRRAEAEADIEPLPLVADSSSGKAGEEVQPAAKTEEGTKTQNNTTEEPRPPEMQVLI